MKGIIFSAPMVRAILEGRKTVTRRPIKKIMPPYGIEQCHFSYTGWAETRKDGRGCSCRPFPCPYFPNEIIYVKEVWATPADDPDTREAGLVSYPASESLMKGHWKIKSALFMPEWAARIELEIVNVRPERLKDITIEECLKEGLVLPFNNGGFVGLWESIYGLGSWEKNPWVWRLEFKVNNQIKGGGDER